MPGTKKPRLFDPNDQKPRAVDPRQLPLDPPRGSEAPERSSAPLGQRPSSQDPLPTNPVPPARTAPSLQQILKQNAGLPDQAAVLGVCDDGLPMLLDLYDPAPGAMVVIGDEREQQLEILHTAVASLAGRNSPRKVQFLILSCDAPAWETWISEKGYDRYCLGIQGVEEDVVRDWIIRLADWTEQRRTGQSSGPSVVLIMDTLSFLPQLSYDIRLNFEWMAKEGPLAQIWPLAAISTDLAKMLNGRRMLRAFQTRIIGYANNLADYVLLAGLDEQEAAGFGRRGHFAVRVGEDWLRFKLLSQ